MPSASTSSSRHRDIAPSGTLRVAIAIAPAVSAFFATRDAGGEPRGVTVDLGRALAEELNLPLELVVYPNSGALTDAAKAGEWDIAFMPKDAERAKKVDFGPAYIVIESTYLVPAGSVLQSIDDVNRPGIQIIAISNTTTARSARRTAPNAIVEEVPSVELMTKLAAGKQGDAFALSRDAFETLLPQLPGARVLPGHFQSVGVCVAVPKGRAVALRFVTGAIERAKASGVVRRALDAAGFHAVPVAPPES